MIWIYQLRKYFSVICVLVAVLIYNKMKNSHPSKHETKQNDDKNRDGQRQQLRKKTVKKLETSDSLNPVIGKMEQEVLKKKQKFKVEEKNE